MNLQFKSVLIILFIFLSGCLVGGLTSLHFSKNKLEQIIHSSPEERVLRGIIRATNPDEEQKEDIAKVFDLYSTKYLDKRETHMREMKNMIDSLLTDIKPILTTEQQEALVVEQNRVKERVHRFKSERKKRKQKHKQKLLDQGFSTTEVDSIIQDRKALRKLLGKPSKQQKKRQKQVEKSR